VVTIGWLIDRKRINIREVAESADFQIGIFLPGNRNSNFSFDLTVQEGLWTGLIDLSDNAEG
jgi:hypothetical protein